MVPYYQNWHMQQVVGLKGPDLAGQRRQQLLTGTRGTTCDSIQQFDSMQFHVTSESRPGAYYEINLDRSTCNCPNFLRSRFCKHLATINVHFPHLCTQESSPPSDPDFGGAFDTPEHVPTPEVCQTSSPQESIQKLMQDIKLLSQQLDDKISGLTDESAPAVMQAFCSVKYSLTAAIAATQGLQALLDKENVPPNQNSWTETAEQMGVKCKPKQRHLPDEHRLTERSISISKGKHKCLYSDPYAGGGRSGNRAKPDALSATANARACAHMCPPVPPNTLPPNALSSPAASPSPPAPAVCIPGPSTPFPQGFAFAPGPFILHTLPPVPGHLHWLRNAPAFNCMPPLIGARDSALAHAGPFASALHLAPVHGEPALAPAPTFYRVT
jgi:hypothetical protein